MGNSVRARAGDAGSCGDEGANQGSGSQCRCMIHDVQLSQQRDCLNALLQRITTVEAALEAQKAAYEALKSVNEAMVANGPQAVHHEAYATCPGCCCRYPAGQAHDCLKALGLRIAKLQGSLSEQQ